MYERFSDRARKVMLLANKEAEELNHEYVGTEHILLGLLRVSEGRGYVALLAMGVVITDLVSWVKVNLQSGPSQITMGKLPLTPRGNRVIEYAREEARNMRHSYVGTEHLLLGLLRETAGLGAKILNERGVLIKPAREVVEKLSEEERLEVRMQERHKNICAAQHDLWNALQRLDILVNEYDRDVFDAAFLESDWDPDQQCGRAKDPSFQPAIKIQRDEMLAKRNVVARLLDMEERHPHDLSMRNYHRKELTWEVECPLKFSTSTP